ncbi:hypothetical protein FF38_00087 [Lucilia cuprina]|uniref:Uncharacterized protein n=1 Tax=Lucilia cuprina TaxID=7375 RepID=A0A0L0BKY8_LUCCU|nr:hypothetical protein FF38_00087 [Lucilia cuprina]
MNHDRRIKQRYYPLPTSTKKWMNYYAWTGLNHHSIPLNPTSKQYTAFTVPGRGLFEGDAIRSPLGPRNFSENITLYHRTRIKPASVCLLGRHYCSPWSSLLISTFRSRFLIVSRAYDSSVKEKNTMAMGYRSWKSLLTHLRKSLRRLLFSVVPILSNHFFFKLMPVARS